MSIRTMLLLTGLCGSLMLPANPIHTQSFDTEQPEAYLESVVEGVTTVQTEDGGMCLALPAELRVSTMKAMPVTPETTYKLTFLARTDRSDTVESNDRAHMEMLQSYGRFLPMYELLFFDSDGEQIQRSGRGFGGSILTSDWYAYSLAFQPPPETAAVKIRFSPRNSPLYIDNLEIVSIDDGTINVNPEFEYGELNYSGWRPARDGRLYTRPDGKTVFKSGYGGVSPFFPLRETVTYQLYARGQRQTTNGWLSLTYYDAEGKRLGDRFLLRPTVEGESVELVPPPGTFEARLVMYSVILESFRVTALTP